MFDARTGGLCDTVIETLVEGARAIRATVGGVDFRFDVGNNVF